MDLDEKERQIFAALLREERNHRFGGSRKAAYTAAKVNSATWTRAEAGDSIKEHSRVRITTELWPWSNGDWVKVATARNYDEHGNPVGGPTQDAPEYVESPGDRATGGLADDAVLRKLDEMQQDLRAMSERLAQLEQERGP